MTSTSTPFARGPVFCARCDQPIHQGQPYDTHVHHAANWAGTTNYSHKECARTAPAAAPAPEDTPRAPLTAPAR